MKTTTLLSLAPVFILLLSATAHAQGVNSITVLEYGEKAPERIEAMLEKFSSGPCTCTPKVEVDWESFEGQKFKYYSATSVERSLKVLNRLCPEFATEICHDLKKIDVSYKLSREGVRLPGYGSDTLILQCAPGYVPGEEIIEKTLVRALHLKSKK